MAAFICIAALALRLLVPAGYMISNEHGQIGMMICSGVVTPSDGMDLSAMHHAMPDHGKPRDHGKAPMPCAFSSLSVQALGGLDAILALVAIAVFVAVARRPVRRLAVPLRLNLRPPSRGPPLFL